MHDGRFKSLQMVMFHYSNGITQSNTLADELKGSLLLSEEDKRNLNGQLTLLHGQRAFMSDSQFKIIPKVGDFYIFPHYLMHSVYPFVGTDEERRSISFNGVVDEKTFDVFI